jgi:hypothetical protein
LAVMAAPALAGVAEAAPVKTTVGGVD